MIVLVAIEQDCPDGCPGEDCDHDVTLEAEGTVSGGSRGNLIDPPEGREVEIEDIWRDGVRVAAAEFPDEWVEQIVEALLDAAEDGEGDPDGDA